ncbi:MAG: hypothetical protein GXO37_01575 [Chloroflexi bacterium]|nr:hypothetical protein [Chloroflexota bacterium]
MNWHEFGKLIRELRKALQTRLGRSVTQADLERMCGFVGRGRRGIVGRLERGELHCMDEEVLVALADVFNLTRLERREFFLAANGVSTAKIYQYPGAPSPEREIEQIIQNMRRVPLPVMITDVFADVVAINRALARLYNMEDQFASLTRSSRMLPNVLYFLFHPRFRFREMFRREEDWRNLLVADVQFFRRSTLQYRSELYWQYLMYRFMDSNEDPEMRRLFIHFWSLAEVERSRDGNTTRFYDLRHPKLGNLRYTAIVSEEVTSRGNLYVITHIPVDDITRRTFDALLRRDKGSEWLRVAPWPVSEKIIPRNGWRPRRA